MMTKINTCSPQIIDFGERLALINGRNKRNMRVHKARIKLARCFDLASESP